MQIVDFGNKSVVLDELLLLLLTLGLDLFSSFVYLFHILIVGFDTISEVHKETISKELEALTFFLYPLDSNLTSLVETP